MHSVALSCSQSAARLYHFNIENSAGSLYKYALRLQFVTARVHTNQIYTNKNVHQHSQMTARYLFECELKIQKYSPSRAWRWLWNTSIAHASLTFSPLSFNSLVAHQLSCTHTFSSLITVYCVSHRKFYILYTAIHAVAHIYRRSIETEEKWWKLFSCPGKFPSTLCCVCALRCTCATEYVYGGIA